MVRRSRFYKYKLLLTTIKYNKNVHDIILILTNVKENEWITLTEKTQNSIKDSIAKAKSYDVSGEKIASIVDKSYNDFFKYTKMELAPTLEKVISGRNKVGK